MRDAQTIAAYEKHAHLYDEWVIKFWENFPREFIVEFASKLPGKRILNLGSGSGRDALLLREQGLEIICIDASKKMVAITSALGFESICTTFADFDYPNQSFDGVWAYTSLIHIPKTEARKVIEKIHSTLKTDGKFVFGAIKGKTAGMIERETMPGYPQYLKKYERNELKQLIKPHGFDFLHEQDYQSGSIISLNQIYKKARPDGKITQKVI
jgi:SAM-dependent methyltransferase